MKVHCVYIPDVTVSICRMFFLFPKCTESILCLYSGCHSVCMPDVIFGWKRLRKCIVSIFRMPFCLYAGCNGCFEKRPWRCIVFIFRMPFCLYSGCHFCFQMKWKCIVYIPDPFCLYAGCPFCLKQWKCIVSIFRMSLCLYSGCHFCFKRAVNVHCVYIPTAILFICLISFCLFFQLMVLLVRFVFWFHFNTVDIHGVYIPAIILCICWMTLLFEQNTERALCIYSGCHSKLPFSKLSFY